MAFRFSFEVGRPIMPKRNFDLGSCQDIYSFSFEGVQLDQCRSQLFYAPFRLRDVFTKNVACNLVLSARLRYLRARF